MVTGQLPGTGSTAAQTAPLTGGNTNIASFPIMANAAVIIYNLPGVTIPLLLDRTVSR